MGTTLVHKDHKTVRHGFVLRPFKQQPIKKPPPENGPAATTLRPWAKTLNQPCAQKSLKTQKPFNPKA